MAAAERGSGETPEHEGPSRQDDVKKLDISRRDLGLQKTGANFILFLTTNSDHCKSDQFMLAGASPCMEPNGKLSAFVPRPVCGRLIICLENPAWKNFASSYDLFRHEIMHALGFGTMNPDKYGNSTKSETKVWNNNDGVKSEQYNVHYMDFAVKATAAARKYFNCSEIVGIEAENEEKIHLSEYVYGNELMTPVISNGPNHFTYLSALILESTHLGQVPWYKTNRTAIKMESRRYWYGRNWGCSFALGSCYDHIWTESTKELGTAFPFCDETDLKNYLYSRKPRQICFSNGNQTKPIPLLHQFPLLRRLLDEIGYPVYGSDGFYRYCPMVKEFLADEITDLPVNAELVIWRHGDRAPVGNYPNDSHGEESWPFGWGELTELGMRQQYALGKLLRKRYAQNPKYPLLSQRYNPKEIYVRSTDVNRTILSAMSNLAGMFPEGRPGIDFPDKGDIWPSHWTPIPVHTVPESEDHVGNILAPCPRADELSEFIKDSPEYKKTASEYHDFLHYASLNSGKEYNLATIYELNDIHYIEVSSKSISNSYRIISGNMLKSLIDHMQQKITCLNSTAPECSWMKQLKYYAYSAHDTTVAALLTTFGDEQRVIRGGLPHYTASIAVELWDLDEIGPAVRILFHSAFHRQYHVITDFTKGCPLDKDFCPLNVFIERSEKFLPGDIKEECRAKVVNKTKERTFKKSS
ncbi:hypothetical protein FO519_006826 [Halicephalobus sp. NKZ332]|nr:hypothetical protein FO519_006826 [Halicephalobus sp. NKZ332]